MAWNGNVLTAKISAFPSQETAGTLSDILMSDVEEKYFLSPKQQEVLLLSLIHISHAFKSSGTGESLAETADAGEHIYELDQGHNSLWGCLPYLRMCLIGAPHQKQKQPVTGCTEQDFLPFTMYPVSYTHLDVYKRQTDTSAEGSCIMREILQSTYQGVGNGETAIFPILIWKKKRGVNYLPEDRNYDLYKLACKVTARRFFPNFLKC